VSFSSLFWIGWLGLMTRACATMKIATNAQSWIYVVRWQRAGLAVVALLFFVNAVHLMQKAAAVGGHARTVAAEIRSTYPDVPRSLLAEIYFDQPDVAKERIDLLRRWGFAPFE
jgi:hypothetical protein